MDIVRQYDVIKHLLSSVNVRTISKRNVFDLLVLLYILYHDCDYVIKDEDSILYKDIELLEGHILSSAIFFDNIGRELQNPYLKHHDSRLSSDEYRVLVEYVCSFLVYAAPENIYPKELSRIYHHFIKQNNCRRIYNPFAGIASIAISNEELNCSYVGQDIDFSTAIAARIRLDAHGLSVSSNYYCDNCIPFWRTEQADAVAAMMPWGLKLDRDNTYMSLFPEEYAGLSYEEYFYRQACTQNNAKSVIGCSSAFFCISPRSLATRKWLCQQRIVDTIIELPSILLNTNLPPYIVILSPQEKHDSVRFVNAKSLFVTEGKRKLLDVNAVLSALDSDDASLIQHVSYEKIEEASYLFSFDYYEYLNTELQSKERMVFMRDIVTVDRGDRCNPGESLVEVTPKEFSSEFIEVCSMVTPEEKPLKDYRAYKKYVGPHIVLMPGGKNGIRIYWHRDETAFCVSNNGLAFCLSSNLVSAEYLIYTLLNLSLIQDFTKSSYMMKLTGNVFANLPLVINTNQNEQKQILDSVKKAALKEQQAIVDATRKRLNIDNKTAVSDLAHMLSTPWSKQGTIIRRLQKYTGDRNSDRYAENVEALISISFYINRLVNAIDVETMKFKREDVDLVEFLRSYVKMMKLCDILECPADIICAYDELPANIDKTMLQVLMDSLIENARRHGFKKEVGKDYQIGILLDKVLLNERPCALISVRNNGLPFPEGFTIKDYISKGRFSGESGRTGLGGYHVYLITKKHDGFMAIRSDEEWNVIIDILLPLGNSENDTIYTPYDYETV